MYVDCAVFIFGSPHMSVNVNHKHITHKKHIQKTLVLHSNRIECIRRLNGNGVQAPVQRAAAAGRIATIATGDRG